MRIIIECQSGWQTNEDMKMSYAPSFRAPVGHIFDVVAQGLKIHVFSMLAQHVLIACSIGTTHAFVVLKVSN